MISGWCRSPAPAACRDRDCNDWPARAEPPAGSGRETHQVRRGPGSTISSARVQPCWRQCGKSGRWPGSVVPLEMMEIGEQGVVECQACRRLASEAQGDMMALDWIDPNGPFESIIVFGISSDTLVTRLGTSKVVIEGHGESGKQAGGGLARHRAGGRGQARKSRYEKPSQKALKCGSRQDSEPVTYGLTVRRSTD